jgi:uncharacterized protein (DUF488 family)
MATLFTIGYEKRTHPNFLSLLEQVGVTIIVDVREYPHSRRRGFSKTALRNSLLNRGISYRHLPQLGSPSPLRIKLRQTGDYASFFSEFEAYMLTQDAALRELVHIVETETCCLLCYEKDPEHCHRKLVAARVQILDGNGLKVYHL